MPGYTKRQLKEDRFKAGAAEAVHWTEEHRRTLIIGVIALGAPIVTTGQPVAPGSESFTSIKDRATAARKKFLSIAEHYPYTAAGSYSRYMAATAAIDAGDNAAAESELKSLASSRNRNSASLAQFALASLYRNMGRNADAIQIYKDLAEKPTDTVPKGTAQLELAGVYEITQPAEAIKLYESIQKENPKSIAAQIASDRLASTKKQQ